MTTIYTAIAAAALALCAITAKADSTVTVNYGPALECSAPVNGVSTCTVVATGRQVQCSIVEGIKICF